MNCLRLKEGLDKCFLYDKAREITASTEKTKLCTVDKVLSIAQKRTNTKERALPKLVFVDTLQNSLSKL